jgi:hypothetical protein
MNYWKGRLASLRRRWQGVKPAALNDENFASSFDVICSSPAQHPEDENKKAP